MRVCSLKFSLAFLFLFSLQLAAAEITADQIVKNADEARGPQGTYSCHVKVDDIEAGTVSSETTYKVYSKNVDLTLIDTIAPPRLLGRKLLMRDNDLWLYLPTVKRPTRVSFQQRLTGEVSNGDIARTNFAKDYDAKLVGTETMKGKVCYKLSLTAKRKEVTYRSIMYWVDKSNFRPIKVDFYALSGKLLKSGEYSSPKPVLGKIRMTEMIITDALRATRQSHLLYSDYKVEKLDDSFFNKETLGE